MRMESWIEMTLGQLCVLRAGSAFKTHLQGKTEGDFPFIKVSDMNLAGNQICIREANHWIYEDERAEIRVKPFSAGTTVFAKIGEALKQNRVRFLVRDTIIDNNMMGAIPNADVIDPKFFYYLLSNFDIAGTASGTALPYLTVSTLESSAFLIPPISVQRRIVYILSTYDELLENNQRRIRILEDMVRSIYREWFVHFRYPGHESDSLNGTIPQGWAMKKLGDVAEDMRRNISKGKLLESQPYVGLEHIPRRSLALDTWETVSELGSNKLAFKKGEILFGKIRPYFHKVSIAPFDGLCSADTIVIRAQKPEHYAIVVSCVSSDDFVAHATATSNGSKMPRANWSVLVEYPIVIPSLSVARQFSAVVDPAIRQMQSLIFQTANLSRTRDLLLPRLLSGQVSLSDVAMELTQ